VVETHGRIDTDRLAKGFEVIPKKRLPYKGRVLAEMDLDAILQRRPKLVLVDELAHTNAPGSRHPKRYLDVQELLEAGIDVYTTLNVQHLESLNDVVARITRIRVRETVPDSIFDRADDVELVDLTPEDLIQRLKEGKVYVPEQAERAVGLVDHQPDHVVDVAHRRQPRREPPRDAQLRAQIGELTRGCHLLGAFVGAMQAQRLGASLALVATGWACGLDGQLWHLPGVIGSAGVLLEPYGIGSTPCATPDPQRSFNGSSAYSSSSPPLARKAATRRRPSVTSARA